MGRRKKTNLKKCPFCKCNIDDMFYVSNFGMYACQCGIRIIGNKVIKEAFATRGCPHYWTEKTKERYK